MCFYQREIPVWIREYFGAPSIEVAVDTARPAGEADLELAAACVRSLCNASELPHSVAAKAVTRLGDDDAQRLGRALASRGAAAFCGNAGLCAVELDAARREVRLTALRCCADPQAALDDALARVRQALAK